ncbi:MAG: sulfatase-like hydrolase/transferase [Verrucomicrobiota bacterium]
MFPIQPSFYTVLVLLALSTSTELSRAEETKPNVLFIAVDDLRPQLTSFGAEKMITPNFDRLAERGVRFDRAYCMVPTCGASRASLMTGIRPTRDRFLTFSTRADQDTPDATTLNTHFKEHGYTALSIGKIFHHTSDNEQGWSEPPEKPRADKYIAPESLAAIVTDTKGRERGPSWENGGDVPDDTYTDGLIANGAIDRLRDLASQPEPFFLAVGFTKPHLPFIAPGPYFEKYPVSEVELPDNYFPPEGAPEGAVHNSGELRNYSDIPKTGIIPEDKAKELIRGYHAATSYTDAHIGRLLDAFDELDLAKNTIIVLWGDHGWNLGEHTLWCKHSCFETSLLSPLVIVTPDSMELSSGAATSSLVEFIDIYPTLCDLAGLPQPEHLHGESLLPILAEPDTQIKDYAVSRFNEGDTIRTDQYRYTIYRNREGEITGHMLYDHKIDPDENVNVANEPDYAEVVQKLAAKLQATMGQSIAIQSDSKQPPSDSQASSWAEQLNLTGEQEPKFLAIQKSMTEKWPEFQKIPADQRKSRQAAFYEARNAELEQLLTPEQMTKLKETRAGRATPGNRNPG